ncbi:MAG: hypothetical protein AAGD88_17530 [Bacteroidota bacterium]
MKANANFLKVILLMFTLIMASCDGEDGAIGPQGEQGIQGPAGTDGQDGTNGVDGNANVIVSDWIATDFSANAAIGSSFSVMNNNITEENINSAAILVYGRLSLGSQVAPWPYLVGIAGTSNSRLYNYFIPSPTDGELILNARVIDGSAIIFDDFSEIRYVIIPASTTTSKNATIDLEKMDYYEVMDYLGFNY